MSETETLKKRKWHHLHQPDYYECCCETDVNRKPGTPAKHRVTWSEYERMLWCYDCKKDMKGFGGIFDGPIPLQATIMMLGEYCFHRWDIKKECFLAPDYTKNPFEFNEMKGEDLEKISARFKLVANK